MIKMWSHRVSIAHSSCSLLKRPVAVCAERRHIKAPPNRCRCLVWTCSFDSLITVTRLDGVMSGPFGRFLKWDMVPRSILQCVKEHWYEKLKILNKTTHVYTLIMQVFLYYINIYRSQWPCGLTHELSSLIGKQRSWVRILLKAWISVCAFILCLCCPVYRKRPCDWLITRPRSPTVCVKKITILKKRPGCKKGL
jgi:hypothetical protein